MQTATPESVQALEYTIPYHWTTMDNNCLDRYLKLSAEMARLIRAHASPGPGLDVGCGDGRSTFEVGRLLGNDYRLTGLDYDARAIHFARLFAPELEFRVVNGTGMGEIPDESIGFICCREVLEHVAPEHTPSFVAEQRRVLRRGGVAVIVVPSVRLPLSSKHYRHFDPQTLAATYLGFEVAELIGFGDRPRGVAGTVYQVVDRCPRFWRLYSRCWRPMPAWRGDLLVACFRKP